MGFWFFMLTVNLLMPLTMLVIGKYFMKNVPTEINMLYGYRTSMSMKNKDTWEFAHKYFGRIWYICGLVTLPITVVLMILLIGKDEDSIGFFSSAIMVVQLIIVIYPIFPTEKALRNNFDKSGNRL